MSRSRSSYCAVVVESLETRRLLHDEASLYADNFGINVGSEDYVDADGLQWEDARGFAPSPTAQIIKSSNLIADTSLQGLFTTTREDFNMSFASPVPNGTYVVSLYFAEQHFDHVGDRVFNVTAEGVRELSNFDILKAAGGKNKAVVKTFTVKVSDGTLNINFTTTTTPASLNAIRVQPAETGNFPASVKVGKITWVSEATAPIKREEAVSFVYRGLLYVVGGYIDGNFEATKRVDVYDPTTNKWSRRNDAPTKITHAGLAVDEKNGVVWMCGGFIGDFPEPGGTDVVWKYDPRYDTWSRGPSLPIARGAGGAAVVNNKLYFFSGSTADRQDDSNRSLALDLSDPKATWRQLPSMPSARNHFGTVALGDKIFLIGGQTGLEGKSVAVSSVFIYDTNKGTWEHTTSMPRGYSHFSYTISPYKDRYILLAGGENPHNNALANVMMFDAQTRSWSTLTSLPDVRRAMGGGIIGNEYVVSGGFKYRLNQLDNTYSADLKKLGL